MKVLPNGNPDASVLIVGQFPSVKDEKDGRPFAGTSGAELRRWLEESGIHPSTVRYTYVTMERPARGNIEAFIPTSKTKAKALNAEPFHGKYVTQEILDGIEELKQEILRVKPTTVIGLGNLPLLACTKNWGITKWRGSMLRGNIDGVEFDFLPTYRPSDIWAQLKLRWIVLHDFRRVAGKKEEWLRPTYNFTIEPTFKEAERELKKFLFFLDNAKDKVPIAVDIETRLRQIACIGFAMNTHTAVCVPILSKTKNNASYWELDEELSLILLMKKILLHKNALIVGQNFLYDQQYLSKLWGIPYWLGADTMIMHHTCLPGTQKGLDFLSSLHCTHHEYWKDESKDWDPKLGERQLWTYNCKDAVATLEIYLAQLGMLDSFSRWPQYSFQLEVAKASFNIMITGVKINEGIKEHDNKNLGQQMFKIREFLDDMLTPFSIFGPKGISSLKMKTLAYDILGLPPKYVTVEKKKRLTAGKDAIKEWIKEVDPIYRPILQAASDFRSLGVYRSTFAGAALDTDRRFRCSIAVAGPVTFRFATSADAFGFGTNMQNIPANQRK